MRLPSTGSAIVDRGPLRRRGRAAATILALSLSVACTGDDAPGTTGPPVTNVATWTNRSGATYQGLPVEVAAHGVAPSVELRASWTSGATVLAAEIARPVADDTIALVVPDAPAGTYQVELFDGPALVARGTVEHLGPRTLAFTGTGSLIDLLTGDVERYADDLRARSSTGRLPLDYTAVIDALVGWSDIAVQGGATASSAEVARIATFVAGNIAGLELMNTLSAGPAERITFGCADRVDSEDAARAQLLRARSSIALATLTAGKRFVDGDSTYAGAYVRAFAGAQGIAAFDALFDAVDSPLVSMQGAPRVCPGVGGLPIVEVGRPFQLLLVNDYRTLEAADAGSGFALREALVDEVARARPFAAGSGDRLAAVLSVAPASVPAPPPLAAVGEVSERIVAGANVVNAMATTMGGGPVPVSVAPAGVASVSMRLDGGSAGEVVTVTYGIEQPDLADTTQATLDVVLGDGLIELGTEPTSARVSPTAVSADGAVIAGNLSDVVPLRNTRAFRWTATSGPQSIGTLNGGLTQVAAISADGSTIVGYSALGSGSGMLRAFRWTELGGMQDLGVLSGQLDSSATAVNADGSVIVGKSGSDSFLWQPGTGMTWLPGMVGQTGVQATAITPDAGTVVGRTSDSIFRLRGVVLETIAPPSAIDFQVLDVSADGETILGNLFRPGDSTPFLWTQAGGIQELGLPAGALDGTLVALSADAGTAVGYAQFGAAEHAVRWTAAEGYEDLGVPAGDEYSVASGVSADGQLIIGSTGTSAGNDGFRRTQPEE